MGGSVTGPGSAPSTVQSTDDLGVNELVDTIQVALKAAPPLDVVVSFVAEMAQGAFAQAPAGAPPAPGPKAPPASKFDQKMKEEEQKSDAKSRAGSEEAKKLFASQGKDFDPAAAHQSKYTKVPGKLFVKGSSDANAIAGNDVVQGQVGDCYFLSSLAAIAQNHPDVIRNAIHANKDGTYTVTLHPRSTALPLEKDGSLKITVDADFPMHEGMPVGAGFGDNNRELWVAIMEKAFAKMHGTYGNIQGGNPQTALEMLTGVPSSVHNPKDVELKQLAEWAKNKSAVVLSSNRQTGSSDADLDAKHAYYVKDVDLQNGKVLVVDPREGGMYETRDWSELREQIRKISVNPVTHK
jgi:hypothetical protein